METEPLFQRLKKSQLTCSLNDNLQMFLPLDTIRREITEDNVHDALSRDTGLTSALKWLRLKPENQIPQRVVKEATKVFAILVLIGEPDAIRDLLEEGLTDKYLPLHPDDAGVTLIADGGKRFSSFAKLGEQRISDFVEKQWIVLAPILDDSGKHTELDYRCALPFVYSDPVGYTKSSAIHKSKLHPAHYYSGSSTNSEYVAAKEFWDTSVFDKEKDNLKTVALLEHDHIIRHLGTFTKRKKHFVIFPWAAGGSLRDFWSREDAQPRDRALILWSLQQMLGVAKAIEALHGTNCRHGDMKPDNSTQSPASMPHFTDFRPAS